MWEKILNGLCRIETVCWYGEPNWIGYFLLGAAALISIPIILFIFFVIVYWLEILFAIYNDE